jgi:hypothetical protein
MIWALCLDLLVEVNEGSPSSFNFDLPLGTYKLKIVLELQDNTMEIGKIPAHETEVLYECLRNM